MKIEGLDKFQKFIKHLGGKGTKMAKHRILTTAGLQASNLLEALTPVDTSNLSGSMAIGGEGNVYELKVGAVSYVLIGTSVEYAEWVNDGYEQKKGQFVPGEWQGDKFVYIPDHDKGMVLTGAKIDGVHMFEKATELVQDELPTIIQTELLKLFSELGG